MGVIFASGWVERCGGVGVGEGVEIKEQSEEQEKLKTFSCLSFFKCFLVLPSVALFTTDST